MLKLNHVRKVFFPGTVNERIAIADLSLRLEQGDFMTVIGSNGAGKSTLLNLIAGTLPADAGAISIAGTPVTRMRDHRRARYVGRVFQDPMAGTAPNMTIQENLSIALSRGRWRGLGTGVTRKKKQFFREQLAMLELGLEDRLTAKAGLLSGGQRQALSLLMATFTRPRILLLDEHTAALDPQRAELITRLTREIVSQHRLTALMVTHNMAQAIELGNRLVMMHEGRIVLEAAGRQKSALTVERLVTEFSSLKGAVPDDRTVLQ